MLLSIFIFTVLIYNMKKLIIPLSKETVEKLKTGRQIDVSGYEDTPLIPEDFEGTVASLYSRGFINLRKREVSGKYVWWIFLTNSGLNFLRKFEVEQNPVLN